MNKTTSGYLVSLTQRRLNAVIWLDSPPLQWLRHALASFEQRADVAQE